MKGLKDQNKLLWKSICKKSVYLCHLLFLKRGYLPGGNFSARRMYVSKVYWSCCIYNNLPGSLFQYLNHSSTLIVTKHKIVYRCKRKCGSQRSLCWCTNMCMLSTCMRRGFSGIFYFLFQTLFTSHCLVWFHVVQLSLVCLQLEFGSHISVNILSSLWKPSPFKKEMNSRFMWLACASTLIILLFCYKANADLHLFARCYLQSTRKITMWKENTKVDTMREQHAHLVNKMFLPFFSFLLPVFGNKKTCTKKKTTNETAPWI